MRRVLCALTDAINPKLKAMPSSSFEIFMLSPIFVVSKIRSYGARP
jgi:hypothetical protein